MQFLSSHGAAVPVLTAVTTAIAAKMLVLPTGQLLHMEEGTAFLQACKITSLFNLCLSM